MESRAKAIRDLWKLSGKNQFEVAQLTGIGRTRFSLAVNGRIELKPEEYALLVNTLRPLARERVSDLKEALIA